MFASLLPHESCITVPLRQTLHFPFLLLQTESIQVANAGWHLLCEPITRKDNVFVSACCDRSSKFGVFAKRVMEQEGAATVRCYAWATLPAIAARLWCGTSCFSFRQPIAKRLKQPKPVWVVSGILPFFSSYQVKSRFFFFVVIPPLSVLLNADNGKSSLSITFKSKAHVERWGKQ